MSVSVQPSHATAMPELLLVANKLSKRFGGLQALSEVSFSICKGDIYGLIGPNGAGKTTLFNVLTSLYTPESGNCNFMGHQLTRLKPHEVARAGLARTFQNIRLFGALSALENVMIGRHIQTHSGVWAAVTRSRREREEEARIESDALRLLEYVGIADRANDIARSLPYGDGRRLEIARALATQPRFILLDEPFAGIDPIAVIEIQRIIGFLKERGIGVLITDHNVRETLGICDHAFIISDGHVLAEGTPEQIVENADVRRVYLGEHFRM